MPHLRKRYAESRISKSLTFSSIVGVLGQRQVGKTTLLEGLSQSYSTFDRESDLLEAEAHPEVFLANRKSPFAIDESQLCPRIFSALKESVRLTKSPGRFLLSGSVRFTSREIIRESLTGRIVSIEVLPFSIREAHGQSAPSVLKRIFSVKNGYDLKSFYESKIHRPEIFSAYLETGGLPGIAFFRDEAIRKQKFEAQIDTLLNRDIRLVIKTTLAYSQLRSLLKYLAIHQGRSVELKDAGDYSQISTVTLKKILFAFEALYLIRPVTALRGGEKKVAYFLEDQGMASWLLRQESEKAYDILRGIYSNLRQELFYGSMPGGSTHFYRTRHGVNVPLVFETELGLIGVIPCADRVPPVKMLGSALAFLKKFPKARLIIAVDDDLPTFKQANLFLIPYYWLV